MPDLPLPSTPEKKPIKLAESASITGEAFATPPTSFVSPMRGARKRTSEEFELDLNGVLTSKHSSAVSPKEKDKTSVRRHRSLGIGIPSTTAPREKGKERRRDTLSVNVKHTRQTSASSSSSSHGETLHSRRVHTTDFSHLPPSPSSSNIQQFLRHRDSNSNSLHHVSQRDSQQSTHSAAHVAHSLLRGHQEGWSDMDDQATVEALRKLDGISGRTARARSSIGGHSRVGSSSRPTTPSKNVGSPREGAASTPENQTRRSSRRISTHASLAGKDKKDSVIATQKQPIGLGIATEGQQVETPEQSPPVTGGEAHSSSSPSLEKAVKKPGSASARSSFTPKRSSGGSTTYTSTPTTSSRDSASLSAATSVTSASALSNRHSTSKVRRNSAGSDISSLSTDGNLRDRVAALASDGLDENHVPPVPPLPKQIFSYKPPSTAGSVQLTVTEPVEEKAQEKHKDSDRERAQIQRPREENSDHDRVVPTLEPVAFPTTPSKHRSFASHRPTTQPTTPTTSSTGVHKTPSKKWSFSNALGKLSKSPSTSSMNNDAMSPRSPRTLSFGQSLRKSTSKDQPLAPPAPVKSTRSSEDWSPINADAMASASSLASLSSIGSVNRNHPISPPASAPPPITSAKTPDRFVPSRSETASSASTSLTASVPPIPNQPLSPTSSVRRGTSSKRLTPSSIPFFHRSSSQSIQFPPNSATSSSLSPTHPSGPQVVSSSSNTHLKAHPPSSHSPTRESGNLSSASVPGTTHKKSVLSLGLPSLLKGSSSRRSLHSDKEKSDSKHSGKDAGSSSKTEKSKKDEKDRSESRISVLMGRKRGKVRYCPPCVSAPFIRFPSPVLGAMTGTFFVLPHPCPLTSFPSSYSIGFVCLLVFVFNLTCVSWLHADIVFGSANQKNSRIGGFASHANLGPTSRHSAEGSKSQVDLFFIALFYSKHSQSSLHFFSYHPTDRQLYAETVRFVSKKPTSVAYYRWISECWCRVSWKHARTQGRTSIFFSQRVVCVVQRNAYEDPAYLLTLISDKLTHVEGQQPQDEHAHWYILWHSNFS